MNGCKETKAEDEIRTFLNLRELVTEMCIKEANLQLKRVDRCRNLHQQESTKRAEMLHVLVNREVYIWYFYWCFLPINDLTVKVLPMEFITHAANSIIIRIVLKIQFLNFKGTI